MSAIRSTLLSAALVFVIGVGAYFAASTPAVRAAQSAPASCPAFNASSLSIQQLRDLIDIRLLNARLARLRHPTALIPR